MGLDIQTPVSYRLAGCPAGRSSKWSVPRLPGRHTAVRQPCSSAPSRPRRPAVTSPVTMPVRLAASCTPRWPPCSPCSSAPPAVGPPRPASAQLPPRYDHRLCVLPGCNWSSHQWLITHLLNQGISLEACCRPKAVQGPTHLRIQPVQAVLTSEHYRILESCCSQVESPLVARAFCHAAGSAFAGLGSML